MSVVESVQRVLSRSDHQRLRRCCTTIVRDGRHHLRTAALSHEDARWFLDRGFHEVQQLVLLEHREATTKALVHSATQMVEWSWRALRSARARRLLLDLLDIDARSFAAPWNLSMSAFGHACQITDDHRIFVGTTDPVGEASDTITGFAIVGRSGRRAYLQRLAVHPAHRRRGVASALVGHAITWATQRGATTTLVNTEESNAAALHLYRSIGFRTDPTPLVVLERAETANHSLHAIAPTPCNP